MAKSLKAYEFALQAHGEQKYGDESYDAHLREVVSIVAKYTYDLDLIQAAWLHDVIEDTSITFEDLLKNFGIKVALLVFACSGEGETRKQRQLSIKYKLLDNRKACIIKAADRIANISRGKLENNVEKLSMYKKEHEEFCEVVYGAIPFKMFLELIKLFDDVEHIT